MAAESTTAPAAAAGTVEIGDLAVNRMGFGAMRISGQGIWGEPADRDEAKRVLSRALELGVDFIDTANSYGPEVSETLIAETLHPYPDGLVIATKGGLTRPGPGEWVRDGRPEALREALEGSLRRLRVDRIDVYQLHSVDAVVPLEESIGALAELQRQGKIRHIGLSNVDARQLAQAREQVEIVSVQNRFNVGDRHSEGVLEACERGGIPFLPWWPLNAGELATAGGRLDEVAASRSASQAQVALAWLLRRSPSMLTIPGTSSVAHLEENVAAAALELTDAEFADLSRSSGAIL
jgi:aryl-alcohol dehydrogenase-like predicted oxidoreductase